MSGLTPTELGAILLALFAVFYALRIAAKFTAALGLVSVVLIGTTGWIGKALTAAAVWAQHLVGSVTSTVIGATFTGLLFVILAVIYLHGLHPKNATGRHHAWIGVALGALIVAGVTGIPALSGLHSAIVNGASTVTSL